MTHSNLLPLVIMAAGQSKRMGKVTQQKPKPLLEFFGKPLLEHFLERATEVGIKKAFIIVGYKADQIKTFVENTFAQALDVVFIDNPQYSSANNLYSLYLARKELAGKPFLLANGDIMVHKNMIARLATDNDQSAIMLDDAHKRDLIDSPSTIVKNGRIYDLGRHIKLSENDGYAVGLYKFNKELSKAFFIEAEKALKTNKNAGFHDPLIKLFANHFVRAESTQGLSWTDVDKPEEITHMEKVIKEIIKEERSE